MKKQVTLFSKAAILCIILSKGPDPEIIICFCNVTKAKNVPFVASMDKILELILNFNRIRYSLCHYCNEE